MGFNGIRHTGIVVKNLDRSIYFYHDVLGLEFASEPSPWFEGADIERAVGVTGAHLRQVNLLAGDAVLELIEYANRPDDDASAPPQNRLGSSHVALKVDDINATMEELSAKGVEFLTEANVVDDGVLAGWRWVYFKDPDGFTLELVEVAYTIPHEDGIAEYLSNRPSLESLT